MTATLDAVKNTATATNMSDTSEADAARELVRMAKEQGLSLTGPAGLLKMLTKTVIETALDEEMTEHLGYEKHETAAKDTANSRNGTRAKTVLTETTGPVEIEGVGIPAVSPVPQPKAFKADDVQFYQASCGLPWVTHHCYLIILAGSACLLVSILNN